MLTLRPSPYLMASLLLILFGSLLAHRTQTNGGVVSVRDIRFAGTDGMIMSGLLYIPAGATHDDPAPGILAIHGYINSRETQDGFAIEFARRGYVVLALDQTGHGISDPPTFANGYGGPDGLRYLRSLDFVDKDNIGLEGHSMGGWAVAIATEVYPEAYRSILLVGSSTGTAGAPEGDAVSPRNLGIIFSEWDEFSRFMWSADIPKDIRISDKLKTVFGTTEQVEIGRLYGSVAEGTARKLYMPQVTHPGDHLSTEAIGNAMEWMQATLEGGHDLPPSDQIWYWKEIGTLLALLGAILFIFPCGVLLLHTRWYASLIEPVPEGMPITGFGRRITCILTFAIPVLTYFRLNHLGNQLIPVIMFWPQGVTTGIMVWAVGNGLITLILFMLWHTLSNRKKGGTTDHYGLTWQQRPVCPVVGQSFLMAAMVVSFIYLLLAISSWAFTIDFRFWVLAIKPMAPHHFLAYLAYLPPFIFFFLILGLALHGQLKSGTVANILLLAGGFVLLILVQYIPLLTGGIMPLAEPLLSIVAFQIVPLLTMVALISTFFFKMTGRIYIGAFINALFITWIIVAGQATQYGG